MKNIKYKNRKGYVFGMDKGYVREAKNLHFKKITVDHKFHGVYLNPP